MSNLSRRGFFKLAAGAAVMAAVPLPAITGSVARLYLDGINCDAEGLEALIAGETVDMPQGLADHIGWRGHVLHLHGDFTIDRAVQVEGLNMKTIHGGMYRARHGGMAFNVKNSKELTFEYMNIIGAGQAGGASLNFTP